MGGWVGVGVGVGVDTEHPPPPAGYAEMHLQKTSCSHNEEISLKLLR